MELQVMLNFVFLTSNNIFTKQQLESEDFLKHFQSLPDRWTQFN